MLAEERLSRIMKLLSQQRTATVQELCEALDAGFTTPDPEEAAVKAAVVHRAREAWFLVDDSKFARIYPAVIAELSGGAILTNHCPNPKYRQFTLVKEAAE